MAGAGEVSAQLIQVSLRYRVVAVSRWILCFSEWLRRVAELPGEHGFHAG